MQFFDLFPLSFDKRRYDSG